MFFIVVAFRDTLVVVGDIFMCEYVIVVLYDMIEWVKSNSFFLNNLNFSILNSNELNSQYRTLYLITKSSQ